MTLSLRTRWSRLAILAAAVACTRLVLPGTAVRSAAAAPAKAPEAVPDSIPEAEVKASAAVRGPKEEIESIHLPAGYHLELVASEPDIICPVICAWDGNGRMYVAEMRTYMPDINGSDQKLPDQPGFALGEHQGRRRLRQAHGIRRQTGAAADGAAAGRPHPDPRDRHQGHLRLSRHQGHRRGR